MAKQRQNRQPDCDNIPDHLKLHYQTIAQCINLVSQEIYSRFIGMLTANSIIITLVGIILSSKIKVSAPLSVLLSVGGIVLCIFWMFLNKHGINWQHKYQCEAKNIEKDIRERCNYPNFEIWSLPPHPYLRFGWISISIIVIFIVIYSILICAAAFNYYCPQVSA